ncbi:MAG: hypothetical protein IPJ30_24625 [Acidobacteria bacterium]|nr:hypothetical protein [Acidobacteriota bacterium]
MQTANPIQLRVELAPPVATTFARDAADFIDGTNITISGKYGYKTVIISPAGAPSAVEYEFAIPVLQDYELSFHYAAKDARPFYVIWNGRKQPREVITETSMPADWIITPAMPRQRATTVAAKIGINTLRLERNGPFPHIATIFLTPTHG